MDTLNRLLVGLDLSSADQTLINYTAYICTRLPVRQVSFIHVERHPETPPKRVNNLGTENRESGAHIHEMISSRVAADFSGLPQVETEVLVVTGDPLKQLLHWATEKQADLILVGRKLRLHGSGAVGQKLLRHGRISVLFVPEAFEPRLRKVVVSLDFSKHSEMALDRVNHFALVQPDVQVACLHVYQVPTGYITLGMSYEDFDKRMQDIAQEKYDNLMERFPDLQHRAAFVLVRQGEHSDVGAMLVMEAKRLRADMLVMGAKGMTTVAVYVIGSVTEKVLRHDMDIPLLVFENKDGEKLGFLDAIME
ncbi:universal stress protein [Pontibacter russatus]|uniref:universal stress protein n=1 Tax=Pontibacter russatus TaxID=2694929 RepID=UPI00137B1919|nr:universal stress protein [Pontibacter russatus]